MFEDVRMRAGSPVVLWLHGLGEHGGCFEAIAAHPALAAAGALIPDLPGYGSAPRTDLVPSLEEVADALAAWLAGRDEPAPIVVGHSMGGVLGVLIAERHPGAVRALIDVDGNVSLGDCTFSSRAAGYTLDAFLDGGWADTFRFVLDRGLAEHGARLASADPRVYHRHAQDLVRLSTPGDLAARRARLGIPVTYVAGYPDGACARSRELLAAAGVACVDIAPAGHWPYVDQPDAFAAAVARLL